MSLVENIQKLCESKGISVSILQKELGFSSGSIYKWDKNSPSVDKLCLVADYFNVSVDYLLGRELITKEEYLKNKPDHKKYILLGEKAMGKGLPVEVLAKLIDLYAEK